MHQIRKKSVKWQNGYSVTNRLFPNLMNGNSVTNSCQIAIRLFILKLKWNLRYFKFNLNSCWEFRKTKMSAFENTLPKFLKSVFTSDLNSKRFILAFHSRHQKRLFWRKIPGILNTMINLYRRFKQAAK